MDWKLTRRRQIGSILRQHSQTAHGFWQAWQDENGRTLLTLTISDPWGSAVADFAPEELERGRDMERRLHRLIGEMINPTRPRPQRERIEICDTFATTGQLEELRLQLGQLPNLETLGLRMQNQVRFLPNRPQAYLLTDFAIEVNGDRANEVRDVLQQCHFRLRDERPLIQRPGVREAVRRLVESHREAAEAIPQLAVWFRTDDREDVHLLEVADDVAELADGSLGGVGFDAGDSIPGARSLIVYLTHENDLRAAWRHQPDHAFFRDLRDRACEFVHPNDGGEAFREKFPELMEVA
jgi:hypothetical protein